MNLYYRDHVYVPVELWKLRTAADIPVTPKDKLIDKESDIGKDIIANIKPLTDKLLSQYGIKPTADLALTKEGDGVDILYNITSVFNALTYIRFDVNTTKKSIQEIQVRLMCKPPHSFVANNANDIKELMVALQVASKATKRSGTLDKLDANATDDARDEYTEILLLYIINSGQKIDITDLEQVRSALDGLDLESDKAANALDVLNRWDPAAYTAFAKLMSTEGGTVVGPTQMVYAAITELTQHEEFIISDATVVIQAYTPKGTVVVGLATPWPTFVELQKSGQKMSLVNFAVQVCNVIMNSGPNAQLAKALLTMQVNLIIAGQRAANPALSKVPEDKYNWTPEQIEEFLNTGIGLYFHERIMENNPMGQFDVWCIMLENNAVECYEKGAELQKVRNEKQTEDRLAAYINAEKPEYIYHYYAESKVMKLYKPGNKAVLKEFKNVDHEFAETRALIATERNDADMSSVRKSVQPNRDWYEESKARLREEKERRK